jgi:uncharacterized protein
MQHRDSIVILKEGLRMAKVGNDGGRSLIACRWFIFMLGLMVMSFGIVLMIKAEMGNAPWDVLHIGLYHQFGLSIGLWSIIIGVFIVALTCMLTKSRPQAGVVINMLCIGLFIDMYMLLPWLTTPEHWLGKLVMLSVGIVVMGYGIGLYIAPRCGAGPRDGLMLALTKLTGWKVGWVRSVMEGFVLLVGWLLGGPVFIGTVIFCLTIGPIVSLSLSQCERLFDHLMGGMRYENLDKRSIWLNHYDGVS